MSYICPACGESATLTACEHCGGSGRSQSVRAELAKLRAKVAESEKERDGFKTRTQVAESQINRAVGAAHDLMPDYPWAIVRAGEELSSACWAWAQGLKGTQQACADLHSQLAASQAECAVMRKALEHAQRAIGEHSVPSDCFATGPFTGNPTTDLLECPACKAITKIRAALASSPNTAAFCARVEAMERACSCLYDLDPVNPLFVACHGGGLGREELAPFQQAFRDYAALRAQEKK